MNRDETKAALAGMFTHVPDAAEHFEAAMTATPIADREGRAPTASGWAPTWDLWLTAAAVADRLHIAGVTRQLGQPDKLARFTSEGATFEFATEALSWADAAAHLRAQSPLTPAAGVGVLTLPRPRPTAIPRSHLGRRR